MAGIGDGILADGVLAEGSNDETFFSSAPIAIVFSVLPGSISIYKNITIGAGTSSLTLTVNPGSVIIEGDITISAAAPVQLAFRTYSGIVEVVSVSDVVILGNTIRLNLTSLPASYVGELVVVGLMTADFSASAPGMAFSISQPTVTFTVH